MGRIGKKVGRLVREENYRRMKEHSIIREMQDNGSTAGPEWYEYMKQYIR